MPSHRNGPRPENPREPYRTFVFLARVTRLVEATKARCLSRDAVVPSINRRISRPISDARKSPRSAYVGMNRRLGFSSVSSTRNEKQTRRRETRRGKKLVANRTGDRGTLCDSRRVWSTDFRSTRPPTANPLVESLVSDSDRCLSRRDPIVSRSPVRVVPRDRTESGGREARKNRKTKEWKKRRNSLEREVASLFAETGTRSRNRVRAKAAELWSRLHGSYSWPRWPLSRISDSTVGAESRLEGGDAAARRSPSRSASPSPFVCVSRRFCCSLHTVTHTGPFVGEGS